MNDAPFRAATAREAVFRTQRYADQGDAMTRPAPVFVLSIALGFAFASGTSSKRMADGKQWTTHNLNVKTAASYCYDNAERNCSQYGRLYTWESAQRACPSLGMGWRLPADDEWRQLARRYGGGSQDSEDKGKASYQALLTGGRSGFNAVLGGGRDEAGQYARGDAHGFYWTATEIDHGNAWYYNFGKGGLALHRQDGGEKPRAFSVRCIKD